jgi:glycosyltransferase involved in cell wall biosynthesis
MKILSLTAGAANMYCGSCLRDNALATELKRQGHDVLLLPMYTPTLTDERNVSEEKVFFGGIGIYLQQKWPWVANLPGFLDKLWDSGWALRLAARSAIPVDPQMLGELTVSVLRGENGRQRRELQKLLDWLKTEPAPDVINLPYTLLIGLAAPLKRALGKPVTCALQGEDLFLEGLREPYRRQCLELIRENLKHVDVFLAVSDYYARFMSDYLGIPRDKTRVVPIGINTKEFEPRPKLRGDVFTIGYFARVDPAKGLHVLLEAYRRVREQVPARLLAAGYLLPEHRAYLADISAPGFEYRGALDRQQKIAFLQELDVLSVPAVYAEPKGLFLLEAMACGTPVVQPRHGAFPEILERTGGGLLVEPHSPEALAEGLLRLWREPQTAERLGRAGAAGVREHYTAAHMARAALEVFESLRAHPVAGR